MVGVVLTSTLFLYLKAHRIVEIGKYIYHNGFADAFTKKGFWIKKKDSMHVIHGTPVVCWVFYLSE